MNTLTLKREGPWQPEQGQIVRDHTPEEINNELAKKIVDKTRKAIEQELDLTEAVLEAKQALGLSVDYFRKDAVAFLDESTQFLKDVRTTRMSLDLEIKTITRTLKDICDFLGDKTLPEKMAHLKELVDTCERLKKLQDSGFMDKVLDTLIKADEVAKI